MERGWGQKGVQVDEGIGYNSHFAIAQFGLKDKVDGRESVTSY